MRPDDRQESHSATPQPQSMRSLSISPRTDTQANHAALSVVRGQLDAIYGGDTTTPTPQTTPVVQPEPRVENTQSSQEQSLVLQSQPTSEQKYTTQTNIQPEQWQQYHSAWQDYYQKYYERYYVSHVYQAKQELEARSRELRPATEQPQPSPVMSQEEAMNDLRSKLVNTLQTSAVKVRKSQHFTPIAAALCVVMLFLFLQYNRVLFANVEAYVSPGSIDPANIIVDPTTSVAVSPEPKLIIPKINVDVPVNYDTTPDYDAQMKAMENGVAWFGIAGANSKPGQVGNTVISGHSSNDVIDSGSYKFIFARLDHLTVGDTVYVNYNTVRYTYSITKKEVVKPEEVGKLIYPTEKPIFTLITCTPLGTSLNRLLVTAEQVSPSPSQAAAAPDPSSNVQASIPGNSPTFLQRIFGGGN
jgi:sortase A